MFANSRAVTSSQTAPHPDLLSVLQKHTVHPFRRPYAPHSLHDFESFEAFVRPKLEKSPREILLDTGCGTGASTWTLAQAHPQSLVIGLDKSAARLTKSASEPLENLFYLRTDLVDFWRIFVERGYRAAGQYFLYPNPWPRAEHLKRRWQGHPVWPHILAAGGFIELRTNWEIYAREFQLALQASGRKATFEAFETNTYLTPFEKKYSESGHSLWRVLSF